jgi:peptide/nickel transport system substrate-binding protein
VPGLARWEPLGPTRYRFTLGEEGRRFHDGTRLIAADVRATVEAIRDPTGGSPHRATLAAVARVEAPDENTVDFFLRSSDPLFPGRLTFGVMPAARLAEAGASAPDPIGSGPFAVASRTEDRLELRRTADGLAVTFLRVADPTMRALKLLKGEVDLLQGDLPPELVAWLGARPGVQVGQGRGTTFTYLAFNLEDPVTARPEVRGAVAQAVDRSAIASRLLRGTARPAAGLLPPEHWAGLSGAEGPRYDPESARSLLQGLGYGPGRPLALELKTSSDPLRLRIATVLQYQLRQVGVDLAVRSYDWAAFYADVKAGRFQTCTLSWVALRSPEIFRYAFHSASLPPAGANRGRYRDALADELIERAETAPIEAEQAARFRELQARLLVTLPYVPLWYEDPVFVASDRVLGYQVDADGGYDGLARVALRPGGSR